MHGHENVLIMIDIRLGQETCPAYMEFNILHFCYILAYFQSNKMYKTHLSKGFVFSSMHC